jgi:hypothetical protein
VANLPYCANSVPVYRIAAGNAGNRRGQEARDREPGAGSGVIGRPARSERLEVTRVADQESVRDSFSALFSGARRLWFATRIPRHGTGFVLAVAAE